MKNKARKEAFLKNVIALEKAAKGAYEGVLLDWRDIFKILDSDDVDMLQCVGQALTEIMQRPADDEVLCLTCEAGFHRNAAPWALFVLRPFAKEMRTVMCSPLCADCFAHVDRDQRILEALRAKLMPDAKFGSIKMQ